MSTRLASLALLAALGLPTSPASAVGESVNGFPSYPERLQHELTNRARVDPQLEMGQCGANCGEAACYTAQPPLYYRGELNHSARFHAAHMNRNGYFAHDSSCQLVPNIDALFPDTCDGSASCACTGGVDACPCTTWNQRIGLFGAAAGGEIIANAFDPEQAFYLWLYEPSAAPTCSFSTSNGHRWLLLTSSGAVGFGADGSYFVGDFSNGGDHHKIPSGSHSPRQSSSVDAWANFFDASAPNASFVDVDGTCTPMALERGSAANGAYHAVLSGVGSGCHRYYFVFQDSANALVTFPEAGSLGIGPEGSCADFDGVRPPLGAGCPAPEPAAAASGGVALSALVALRRSRHARVSRPSS